MEPQTTPWRAQEGWLEGRAFDGVFIGCVLALAVTSGLVVTARPDWFMAVFLLDIWLLGYHHVISTFTKLAGTPEDRRQNRFLLGPLPLLVLAGVLGLQKTLGTWSIVTVYFFWQWYHYVRQSYGIAVFYKRKAPLPVKENDRLALVTLWALPAWGMLNRCWQGWDSFLGLPIYMPQPPAWLYNLAPLVCIALLSWWAVRRVLSWREGRLPLGHTLFMLSHFAAFYVSYIWIDDISAGWLVANVWHNAQYILFVWLYQKNRFERDDLARQTEDPPWLQWFAQNTPLRIACYFAASLAVTSLFYGTLQHGVRLFTIDQALIFEVHIVLFQAINFHHYVVDSQIWKARKKVNRQALGIAT